MRIPRFLFGATICVCLVSAAAGDSPGKLKAIPFDARQTRLLAGPFKQAEDLNAAYLRSFDLDRLLHTFRLNAGLPTTAEPLGGWEAPAIEVRGHFLGHYLSAISIMYRKTGDAEYKRRLDYLVAELAKCQQALGGGYLSAFPASHIDRVEAGQPVWAPYYVIHKIMAGLIDANVEGQNAQALDVVQAMATYFKGRCDKLNDAQMAIVMGNEFGGMNEALANLYAITHNPDHLALARRFDHHAILDPLANRQDQLKGLHANTQFPKVIGAARLFELTGDERDHTIAEYFWDQVTGRHSFVTGGNSVGECFKDVDIEAGDLTVHTAETCNTYNMLKLTRRLFEIEPSAKLGEYYERALFNHILPSIDPDSGMTTYYFSLKPGHFRTYANPFDSFWCCTGTGVENHATLADAIYYHDDHNLWVNLFIASEVDWPEQGLTLRQDTEFPKQEVTTFVFKLAKPAKFALRIRHPRWAKEYQLSINGQPQQLTTAPGGEFCLDQEWHDGDRLELKLPMKLRLERAHDLTDQGALMYGPIVLAGALGRQDFPPSDHAAIDQNAYEKVATPAVPSLVVASDDPSTWITPVEGKPLEFVTKSVSPAGEIHLKPLYDLPHERYTVYWKLMTP